MTMTKPRTFTEVVNALRFGELNEEATAALKKLVLACGDTGRGGKITLSIALKPGRSGQMEIEDSITLKLPEKQKGSSLMFPTPEGNLQRDHPKQMTLEGVRVVDRDTGEILDVSSRPQAASEA